MTAGEPVGVPVEVLPVGDQGLLLEVADLDAVLALDGALRAAVADGAAPWREVTDVVPAARTVLLLTRERTDLAALRAAVIALADSVRVERGSPGVTGPETAPNSHEVEILVRYDGPDLDDVARLTGLDHRRGRRGAHRHVVAGRLRRLRPGVRLPGRWRPPAAGAPTRPPRPSVPAGAVGLAGEFSGVYPRSSPGGWQLLGSTESVVWDVDRDPPALLGPGTTVRFVDAGPPT